MNDREIHDRFRHHAPPKLVDGEQLTQIREAMEAAAQLVLRLCPQGREQSLAVTHLEEAMFWANAAIARTWP